MNTDTRRIFLSHSHQDDAFGDKLVELLRDAGADVWYDEHSQEAGQLRDDIERELRARETFMVILSPSALRSDWVIQECQWALQEKRSPGGKTILPVLYRPCAVPDELADELALERTIVFSSFGDDEEAFADLMGELLSELEFASQVASLTSDDSTWIDVARAPASIDPVVRQLTEEPPSSLVDALSPRARVGLDWLVLSSPVVNIPEALLQALQASSTSGEEEAEETDPKADRGRTQTAYRQRDAIGLNPRQSAEGLEHSSAMRAVREEVSLPSESMAEEEANDRPQMAAAFQTSQGTFSSPQSGRAQEKQWTSSGRGAIAPAAHDRETARRTLAPSIWSSRAQSVVTIIGWIAIGGVAVWIVSRAYHALIVLGLACVLAYALHPAVEMLRRWLPQWLAILVVYLALFAIVGGLSDLFVSTTIANSQANIAAIKSGLRPDGPLGVVVQQLEAAGISRTQIDASLTTVVNSTMNDLKDTVGLFFTVLLDTVLVVVVSVYLLIDGERLAHWANTGTPRRYRPQVQALLAGLQRVVGGYIRGQLSMALLIGVLVGVGMFALRVPFAPLLGLLAFVLEFIPIIGTLISGAICVLIALTQGWLLGLVVLAYFVVVHVIEGDVVGPRIVGQTVGLHPVISIIAVAAGVQAFGIWGLFFAAPLAGLLQVIIVDIWREWRKAHAEEFAEELEESPADQIPVAALVDSAAAAVLLDEPEISVVERSIPGQERIG